MKWDYTIKQFAPSSCYFLSLRPEYYNHIYYIYARVL
jgi:hypothetical protein